jgi:3,2-trans-enoyl-CoA isomerase
MACDYRIMATSDHGSKIPPSMGLNETRFGFVAPPFLAKLLFRTIGIRNGEKALQLGTLFKAEEALDIGLVDELVPAHYVIQRSHEVAQEWNEINPKARFESKMIGRKEFIYELLTNREEDTQHFCNFVTDKHVQSSLTLYMNSLKRKSKS